jgi:gallate dioxygenase
MANIIGAIASSHTPTIGFALDANKQHDAVWAPIFKAYEPVRQWLAEKKPDVLVMIYNDHVTSFFFDHYSAFALGIGKEWKVADEGGGARDLPPVIGHAGLARHIGQSLVADEFDMSFFQDKPLDHGCFSPLSIMWPQEGGAWPGTIVPLQCGVLQFPVPSARRCFKLGQALRRAIESYPEDLDVAIVATGGLSHQVHGERCGFNNPEWDQQFLDLFEKDPEVLLNMTQADFARLGGWESAEIVMWMVMRGAMPAGLNCLHREYYLPSMTGIAVAVYESAVAFDPALNRRANELQREHIAHQTRGVEELEGTYPFTLERSVRLLPHQQLPAPAGPAGIPHPLPGRSRGHLRGSRFEPARARHDRTARLAGTDPLRRDLLPAGEAGRRGRRLQPAHLCRHARPVAGRLPEDAQYQGPVLGSRERERRQRRLEQGRQALGVQARPLRVGAERNPNEKYLPPQRLRAARAAYARTRRERGHRQ